MKNQLPANWQALLAVFQNSHSLTDQTLVEEIHRLDIDPILLASLVEAILGDNRPLNKWLFSQGDEERLVAWIAPISASYNRFAWMIGKTSKTATEVCKLFQEAHTGTKIDNLLRQDSVPQPLLFVEPFWVSTVKPREEVFDPELQDEFAIFQVGYKDTPVEVSDFDQRMVINTTYLVAKRRTALVRLRSIMKSQHEVLEQLDVKLETYAITHTEGHNQGHFVGVWPYEDKLKKNCVLYEAVEEFRACIAASLIAEYMPLSEVEKDAFAACVFITRFFGYGYDAWLLKKQTRETAREITVGLMFFEWLLSHEVIVLKKNDDSFQLRVNFRSIRPMLKEAFRLIGEAEEHANRQEVHLQEIARDWYRVAFPNGTYSENALLVYNTIRKAVS